MVRIVPVPSPGSIRPTTVKTDDWPTFSRSKAAVNPLPPTVGPLVGATPPECTAETNVSPTGNGSATVMSKASAGLVPAGFESVTVNVMRSSASPPVGTATFVTWSTGSTTRTLGAETVVEPPVYVSAAELLICVPGRGCCRCC